MYGQDMPAMKGIGRACKTQRTAFATLLSSCCILVTSTISIRSICARYTSQGLTTLSTIPKSSRGEYLSQCIRAAHTHKL